MVTIFLPWLRFWGRRLWWWWWWWSCSAEPCSVILYESKTAASAQHTPGYTKSYKNTNSHTCLLHTYTHAGTQWFLKKTSPMRRIFLLFVATWTFCEKHWPELVGRLGKVAGELIKQFVQKKITMTMAWRKECYSVGRCDGNVHDGDGDDDDGDDGDDDGDPGRPIGKGRVVSLTSKMSRKAKDLFRRCRQPGYKL